MSTVLHKCIHRLIYAYRIRAKIKEILQTSLLSGFTEDDLFNLCMLLSHHHLEWIFIYKRDWTVCVLHEYPHSSTENSKSSFSHCKSLSRNKDLHSSARQPNATNNKQENMGRKQFLKDLCTRLLHTSCLPHCYKQVNLYNSECFCSWRENKKRGLRIPENLTSVSYHGQLLSSPAS